MSKVLELHGEIDFHTSVAWRADIAAALAEEPDVLALDLAGVTFIDSKGLGLLVGARADCIEHSTRLELRRISVKVRAVLILTGLDAVFDLGPDEEVRRQGLEPRTR